MTGKKTTQAKESIGFAPWRNRVTDLWQTFGLRVINTLARTADYEVVEVTYGAGEREKFDWYRTADKSPTVIFYYGGNWRSGRKQDFRFVADTLCGMGVNVVVPDFPLYPSARFGAILASAVAAANHFMQVVDPEARVILMGHSSGAQKAALLALDDKLIVERHRLLAMIGLAGPYDFFPFSEDDHWDLFGPEEHYPRSQPVNYVRADAPPLYLLHGRDDIRVRRGHSKSLMEKQQAAGGQAAREVYDGMGHVDAVVSFSRIHRRNNPLIRDIQSYIQALN